MNILDRLIGWINPQAGAEREAWRQALEEMRHYDAGSYGRANANWYAINQSAETTDRYSRDVVRARARDLERNSDVMTSVISPFIRNVVGKGLILQAETGNAELNKDIEKLWKVWTKKRNCDVTGTQSLNQILRMAVRRKKVDGGILIVKRYTRGGVLPFKLQLFEVDELDGSQVAPKHQGNRVVGGIEYDRFNAPVGYWIRQYTLDGMSISEPVFLKADDVIFYFSKRRPSQLREMSDMSQTVTRVRDVNEYITAVSVKQRIEACFGIAVKRNNPTSGIGRMPTQNGPVQTYAGKTVTPGMILEMNPGEEIQAINPQGQASDASSFVKLLQRLTGAGQGISYEATSRDMSQTNYSSADGDGPTQRGPEPLPEERAYGQDLLRQQIRPFREACVRRVRDPVPPLRLGEAGQETHRVALCEPVGLRDNILPQLPHTGRRTAPEGDPDCYQQSYGETGGYGLSDI